MNPHPRARPIPAGPLAARACAWGLGAGAVVLVLLLATGLVPPALRGLALLGGAVAAVAGCLGAVLLAWLATAPPEHPKLTQRYLLGMVLPFLLQVVTAGVGCGILVLLETKFEGVTAFGLSFAAAVTALHTAAVVVVARALRARAGAPVPPERPSREAMCAARD